MSRSSILAQLLMKLRIVLGLSTHGSTEAQRSCLAAENGTIGQIYGLWGES